MQVIDVLIIHLVLQEYVRNHKFLNIDNPNKINFQTLAEVCLRVPLCDKLVYDEMRLLNFFPAQNSSSTGNLCLQLASCAFTMVAVTKYK